MFIQKLVDKLEKASQLTSGSIFGAGLVQWHSKDKKKKKRINYINSIILSSHLSELKGCKQNINSEHKQMGIFQ